MKMKGYGGSKLGGKMPKGQQYAKSAVGKLSVASRSKVGPKKV